MTKKAKRKPKGKGMKRVTVARVRAAYAKTGLTPIQGMWVDVPALEPGRCPVWTGERLKGRACAIAAVAIAETATAWLHAHDRALDAIDDAVVKYLGLSENYMGGFVQSFDGEALTATKTQTQWRMGYADGSAARKALRPKSA